MNQINNIEKMLQFSFFLSKIAFGFETNEATIRSSTHSIRISEDLKHIKLQCRFTS